MSPAIFHKAPYSILCRLLRRWTVDFGNPKLKTPKIRQGRHERTHTEASICILCRKPTWSCAALIEHCNSKYKEKNQFVCQTCGFYNYSEVMLKLHTVQVYMKGTMEYDCTECDYKYSNQSTFAAHVRNHSTQSFYV